MKWSDFSSSKYLSSSDFGPREELRQTVAAIRSELVGRERDNKPVLHFREQGAKPLVLNKANQRALATCGPAVEDCEGASVILHVIETEFSGEPVRGIRIKLVVPSPSAGFAPNAKQRAQGQTAAQETASRPPFEGGRKGKNENDYK